MQGGGSPPPNACQMGFLLPLPHPPITPTVLKAASALYSVLCTGLYTRPAKPLSYSLTTFRDPVPPCALDHPACILHPSIICVSLMLAPNSSYGILTALAGGLETVNTSHRMLQTPLGSSAARPPAESSSQLR